MPLILVLFFASGYCFLPAFPCGRKSVCSLSIRAKSILSWDPNPPCLSKQRSMPLPSPSKVGRAAAPGAEQGFMFPAQRRKIGAGWEQLPPWAVQQLHRDCRVVISAPIAVMRGWELTALTPASGAVQVSVKLLVMLEV